MDTKHDCPRCHEKYTQDDAIVVHLEEHEWKKLLISFRFRGVDYPLVRCSALGEGVYKCPVCNLAMAGTAIYWHMKDKHEDDLCSEAKRERSDDDERANGVKRQRMTSPDPIPSSDPTYVASSDPPEVSAASDKPTDSRPKSMRWNFAKSMKNVEVPQKIKHLKLDTSKIFNHEHNTAVKVLNFIAAVMDNYITTCTAHTILDDSLSPSHDSTHKCTHCIFEEDSHFHAIFQKLINAPFGTCFFCFTPLGNDLAFNHVNICGKPQRGGGRTERSDWEEWWRVIPYLVWRVPELRATVFKFLGIDEDQSRMLEDTFSWAKWLSLPVVPRDFINKFSDRRLVNLVAVVYAYLFLKSTGGIETPAGGFSIEGADPALTYSTSINEKFINNLDAIRDEDYRKHCFNCYRYCYRYVSRIVFDVGVADYTFRQLSKSRSLMYMMSRSLLFNFCSRNWIHFHYTMSLLSLVFPCSVRLPATNHAAYHNSTKQRVANLPPS
ncbi:hypothetical protein AAF712_013949 [Marasmius tenuissimus]|uniref:C2H2-type domain-containing protein n=1 Tax=Marasmius tenuissimus TaxID=585030 RepID=A0ABR2ZFT8_9AGAR